MSKHTYGVMKTATEAEKAAMAVFGLAQEMTDQTATLEEVAPGVAYMRILIVNVCYVGEPVSDRGGKPSRGVAIGNRSQSGKSQWVLVDAGLPGSEESIVAAAEKRFGKGARPKAILLTHGHFDHVGAVVELAEHWDVSVYAHEKEMPYLTGKADYPPAEPNVGGGLLAKISPLYPRAAIKLGDRVKPLPDDGSVPAMPGWKWIHTPGHTPGHVAFFRESDRVLIVGDTFVTTKQESAVAVFNQTEEIHGPPQYFTPDWETAKESVARLRELNPSVAVPGHGLAMKGDSLSRHLELLVDQFASLAVPKEGRYVH